MRLDSAVERVRFALEQRGFPAEIVRAATPASHLQPLRARRVAEALQGMRTSEDFQALAVLFKRVKNIAKELAEVAGRSIATRWPSRPNARCSRRSTRGGPRSKRRRRGRLHAARSPRSPALRPAVDRFFTEVFVMADDVRVRTARLTLMANLRDLF